jgi:crotonobetainyl-CoA:carnitine CoA-transferase CaiB-like acyl-CoA transferase
MMNQEGPKSSTAPLTGVRVIEFSHMVMGPSCGMVLGDLGADVIKVEPTPAGDNSRRLTGSATGFFPTYNRNKRSLCVDLKSPAGLNVARRLISTADVLVENFRPGAMDKLGLGYSDMAELNERLIYCACKGFLPGPYEHRAALDEVVQMMGGLAYMTGPPGQPLRAGASVNDIMGGVFGAVAVLAALRERDQSGRGSLVQSGLFETNMTFVGQHMAYAAITGKDLPSFGDPAMGRPWPIYDVFDSDVPDAPVFVGVVTDTQWKSFCKAFGLQDFLADPLMKTMADLTAQRNRIRPRVAEVFRKLPKQELMSRLEALGLPFAPVGKPSDMFNDHHLLASGGLLSTKLDTPELLGGKVSVNSSAGLPALPISLKSGRPGLRRQPPHVGEHSIEIAREAGMSDDEIAEMIATGSMSSHGH